MSERSELGAGGCAQPHATAAGSGGVSGDGSGERKASGEVNASGEVSALGGGVTSGGGVTPGRVEASTRWSDAPAERREARA
ncbi:hypothetical protein ACIRST_33395 [Kitasatospora sp. NPDC101447]|uniref:hypothetical protein n=1 Tax=Kitasatospora sp. NPDC101447 TaxID=3364102 RepID=UPI003823602F